MLNMELKAPIMNMKVQSKRDETLERLVTGKRRPRRTPGECSGSDGDEDRVQHKREWTLGRLTAGAQNSREVSDRESSESDEETVGEDVQDDAPPESNLPLPGALPQETSGADVFAALAPIPLTTDAVLTIGRGGRYICAACGDACIAPVQVAMDVLLSTSLWLLELLRKWPTDRGLHMEINISYLLMSEAFDDAMGILKIRGVGTS